MKMIKIVFTACLILISISIFSQIEGEWMASYSYIPGYEGGFDTTKKKIEHNTVLVIKEDSLSSIYSEKWRKERQAVYKYEYEYDSLFFKSGKQTLSYQLIASGDTLKYIDEKYKGFYIVLYLITEPKHRLTLEKVQKKLLDNSYTIDYSELFTMTERKMNPMLDTISFEIEGKTNSGKGGIKEWELIGSDLNLFLSLDEMFFQIYDMDKKGFILKSYFEKENTFRINLIK